MKHAGSLLMALGALMLLFYPSLWVYGKISQFRLHQEWQNRAAAAAAPPGSAPRKVVGRLVIPKLWLDQIVLEGVDDAQLTAGPGHFPQTAMPGEGNCAIIGHLNIDGSPFKDLNQLSPGDVVAVQTDAHLAEYQVSRTRIVSPEEMDILDQEGPSRLELITCMPGARSRYVVFCKQTNVE